ncbi:MAG: hypothetical protein OXQ89_14105 [Rhodospirillaceae bacterium]|nr:hypothetical protein [Rhodospirillaceae bacterium]MDD9998871.1 hypothetical protein [Rhodospirillaceae bacterium]MDE0359880.1 hypothetical protein [Rhodospirillaceae bacterium]
MPRLLLLNNAFLFLCCSIFLGTGVSLVFFHLPLEPQLNVDNYYVVLIEPVENATVFFTYVTVLMLIAALIMLGSEWLSGLKWPPIIVLLSVITATVMAYTMLFPINEELEAGITDNVRLATLLAQWADFNRLRVSLWLLQWLAMMYYFYALARRARADR